MSPRVLCIEGDPAVRATVRRLLEKEGFAVDESTTGLAGIERARVLPPDLVLADVHLPDIEGYELASRLKQEKSLADVPFVAVGHSPQEHDVALAAGADGFIEQPIDQDHFIELVRAFLAGKRERLESDDEVQSLRVLCGSLATRLEASASHAERTAQRLDELDRLKSAFMHNLAHELSTPLTPLAGYLKILQSEKLGALSPQQKKLLESMGSAVTRLSRILDNLSDFATLQSGTAPILVQDVDPDALAEDVVAEQRAAIKEARLHVTVTRGAGGRILADGRKLRQAIANVVANAVKFSPHGGEILVDLHREGDLLRIAIYDQGPGIAAGDAVHIFEPFYHAASRGEEARQPGSGLGLPVARRIAEAHGGRIWVESPPRTQPSFGGRHYTGTKVVIEIPVKPSAASVVHAPSPVTAEG
jgi:signal transduction histidine kinase